MNINELEELANTVSNWSNCDEAWLDTSEDTPAAVFGSIDEDGETYPVAIVDCEQYFAASDSLKLAKFYAATNPSAISELIAAYRGAIAALDDAFYFLERHSNRWDGINGKHPNEVADAARAALATAKRLGVE